MQRLLWLFCAITVGTFAQNRDLTFDQLFTRPYVWGTPPEQVKWSKQNHTLVFLWNCRHDWVDPSAAAGSYDIARDASHAA
jgi:hypothetical protein